MSDDLKKPVQLYLNPGEIVIAESPASVTTVLGSCVAVTLFAPQQRFGAICHSMLPFGHEGEPGKYVDQSVGYMIASFREHGISPARLVAKVFGGADMFGQVKPARAAASIGMQNIQAALATLELHGIAPVVVEVGGGAGRKMIFRTHTGEVFLKRVEREHLNAAEYLVLQKRGRENAAGSLLKKNVLSGAGVGAWQKKSK